MTLKQIKAFQLKLSQLNEALDYLEDAYFQRNDGRFVKDAEDFLVLYSRRLSSALSIATGKKSGKQSFKRVSHEPRRTPTWNRSGNCVTNRGQFHRPTNCSHNMLDNSHAS